MHGQRTLEIVHLLSPTGLPVVVLSHYSPEETGYYLAHSFPLLLS